MNFEEFWKVNRDRYEKLLSFNIMLAVQTAAEDAWEISLSNTVSMNNAPTQPAIKADAEHCPVCAQNKNDRFCSYCGRDNRTA